MSTEIGFVDSLGESNETQASFNYPKKVYYDGAKRTNDAAGVNKEAQDCTYNTLYDLNTKRLLRSASLLVTPTFYKEGTLFSAKPTGSTNGNFTVTRATTATRVNAAGLVELVPYNLLTWSEQFNDAIWSKLALTVTANNVVAPNGTLTADTLSFVDSTSRARQSLSLRGGVYTLSVYAKTEGGTGVCRLRATIDGTYGTLSPFTPTSTWQRFEITFTALTSLTDLEIRSADAVGNFAFWGAQLVEGTSARDYQMTETRLNIPRLDYSLGSCPNILLEPQRTNLLINSIFLGETTPNNWTNIINTGFRNITTSTKTNIGSAYLFVCDNQRSSFSQSIIVTSGITYSLSYTVESVLGDVAIAQVSLFTGIAGVTNYYMNGVNVSSSSFIQEGIVTITLTPSSTTTGTIRLGLGTTSNSIGTIILSMPQLEAGAYATSYIPTTSASVTRNADVISRGNIFTNGLVTASGGTWFVELRGNIPFVRDGSGSGLFLTDATAGSFGFRIKTFTIGTTPARVFIGKVVSGIETTLYTTISNTSKIAIKWNGTTADIFANGVKVISATSFTDTLMQLIQTNVSTPFNINSMALFPTPLTDGECSMLTSGIYTPALAYAQLGLVSESPACLDSSVNALL